MEGSCFYSEEWEASLGRRLSEVQPREEASDYVCSA